MDIMSPQINELATALAKAQSEMPLAEANSKNPFFKCMYTDLATYIKTSRPSLTKNNLSVSQFITTIDRTQKLCTILMHSSGQYILSEADINPSKSDIQSLGSYLTYLKRYMYASIIGCASGAEDDDGEIAVTQSKSDNQYISRETVVGIWEYINQFPKELKIPSQICSRFRVASIEKIEQSQLAEVKKFLADIAQSQK